MDRVLVTGHRGYIGSNLVWSIKQKYPNAIVDGLDFARPESRPGSKGVDALCKQVFNLTQIVAATPDLEYDAIFHLAATSDVGAYNSTPFFAIQNTIGAMKILHVPHRAFVFASSAAADHCHSMYGKTKALCEDLIGERAAVLRLHNVCGAIPESGFYEDHCPETHLIPQCILNDEITVYGYGTQIRDYVHVADVCDEMILNAERLLSYSVPIRLNDVIGTGTGHTVDQVIKLVEGVAGKSIRIVTGDHRTGDVTEQVGPVTNKKRRTLEESIQDAVDAYKKAGLL